MGLIRGYGEASDCRAAPAQPRWVLDTTHNENGHRLDLPEARNDRVGEPVSFRATGCGRTLSIVQSIGGKDHDLGPSVFLPEDRATGHGSATHQRDRELAFFMGPDDPRRW